MENENKKDLKISELKQMQFKLFDMHEDWNDMEPKYAKDHMLYMVEELGECISIMKKKKVDGVMNDEHVRTRFIEELGDVLMYYIEVMNRLDISAEEFTKIYLDKYNTNLNRNYVEENKKKYV